MVVSARPGSAVVSWARSLVLVGVTLGCSSVPVFPLPPHDAGMPCSDASPCAAGQTCLQGICYASCDMTHPCAAREMCSGGACVLRTTDAGINDAGHDGGVCAVLRCASPNIICRADVGACVMCDADNRDQCGGGAAVCDVGRGTCTPFAPAICAPCNTNADCGGGMTCVTRVAPEANERVCLPSCSSTTACPSADLTCTAMQCVPFSSSCTAYRAAVNRMPCSNDSDCPQLGATIDDGLVTGMCFDDGLTGGATCHVACGTPSDCPGGLGCGPPPAGGPISFCQ